MRRVLCRTATASLERRASISAARPPPTSPTLTPATRRIALSHTVSIRYATMPMFDCQQVRAVQSSPAFPLAPLPPRRPFSTNPHRSSGLPPEVWVGLTVSGTFFGCMVLLTLPESTYYRGFDRVVLPVVRVLGGPENAHSFVRWAMAKGWLPKVRGCRKYIWAVDETALS